MANLILKQAGNPRLKLLIMRKKRVLKRNDYRLCVFRTLMPSGVIILREWKGGIQMLYPCGTERWISNSWYDNINTDLL